MPRIGTFVSSASGALRSSGRLAQTHSHQLCGWLVSATARCFLDFATGQGSLVVARPPRRVNISPRASPNVRGIARTSIRRSDGARPPHDVGGDSSLFGPIFPPGGEERRRADDLLEWERQCHSLFAVLASRRILSTDELRRAIESLAPDQYGTWTYYERWSAAMTSLLLERGVVDRGELDAALFGPATSPPGASGPLYRAGDPVRVRPYRRDGGGVEWRRPHVRTPGYVYGVAGVVERVCGLHGDPSFLAFGLEAPEVQLYRVRFRMRDVWPERRLRTSGSAEGEDDVVEAEIYEHWLEPADATVERPFEGQTLFDHGSGGDCATGSHHHHYDHGHEHELRPSVEERAVRLEGPPRPGRDLHQALRALLLRKGIVSADELRSMSERMDTAGKRLEGAALVARAWVDPHFGERLLRDAAAAAAELGVEASNPNAPTVLTVLPNTPTVHNLVVCTLCSCYPSGLLGIAPSWYKSREYRARAVREPRRVLEEFGTSIPGAKRIRVHDSTADHRYIVLPERPLGTEEWSEEELRGLISRDSMIGVAVPSVADARVPDEG